MARRDDILVSKTLYQVGMVTLLSAILWVGVGIYSATNQELKVEVDKSMLEPINPTLDQELIKALSSRPSVEIDLQVDPVSSTSATVSASIEAGVEIR